MDDTFGSRTALLLLALTLLLSGCGGDDDNGTLAGNGPQPGDCIFNTITQGCECIVGSAGRPLRPEENAVDNCDEAPPGVEWQCCYSLNSLGETDYCDCAQSLCIQDTDTNNCECGYQSNFQAGQSYDNEVLVDSCTHTECCRRDDACDCLGPFQVCNYPEPATSCVPPTAPRDCASQGHRAARSCAGLTWQQ